jgi:hypothetical protein
MRATCVFAVASLMNSRSQISGLDSPATNRSRTSRSRGLVAPDMDNPVRAFTAGAVGVMVLVRRVLGDRDRRLGVAEREREFARQRR